MLLPVSPLTQKSRLKIAGNVFLIPMKGLPENLRSKWDFLLPRVSSQIDLFLASVHRIDPSRKWKAGKKRKPEGIMQLKAG